MAVIFFMADLALTALHSSKPAVLRCDSADLIFRKNQNRFVAPVTHPFDAAVWIDVVPVDVRCWLCHFQELEAFDKSLT
jgi:hypothetical protein